MELWKNRYGGDEDGGLNERVCLVIIIVAIVFLAGIVLLAIMTPEP